MIFNLLGTAALIAGLVFKCLALGKTGCNPVFGIIPFYGDYKESRACTSKGFSIAFLIVQIVLSVLCLLFIFWSTIYCFEIIRSGNINNVSKYINSNITHLTPLFIILLSISIVGMVMFILSIIRFVKYSNTFSYSGALALVGIVCNPAFYAILCFGNHDYIDPYAKNNPFNDVVNNQKNHKEFEIPKGEINNNKMV